MRLPRLRSSRPGCAALLIGVASLGCGGAGTPATVAPVAAVIDDGGVGAVRLGAALPAALLGADAEQRYLGRLIADGQPFEAFRLVAPPVLAAFSGGVGFDLEPGPEAAGEAVQRGRAGQLIVTSVQIEDPGPRTAAGTGVGSSYAELQTAHGGAELHPVPPTWGGDECAASVTGLARVWFYFADCAAAEAGAAVVRIALFDPTL